MTTLPPHLRAAWRNTLALWREGSMGKREEAMQSAAHFGWMWAQWDIMQAEKRANDE